MHHPYRAAAHAFACCRAAKKAPGQRASTSSEPLVRVCSRTPIPLERTGERPCVAGAACRAARPGSETRAPRSSGLSPGLIVPWGVIRKSVTSYRYCKGYSVVSEK